MSFLITPDLQKFMEATDMEGHIYNPSDFMDETLEWIEGRNKKSGCWIPCLYENDLRLLPGTLSVWAGVFSSFVYGGHLGNARTKTRRFCSGRQRWRLKFK